MSGGIVGTAEKRNLLAGVSCAVLAIAGLAPLDALAAEYTAGNATDLQNAINAANASSDASATIKITASFSPGVLPSPSKPITIDTQGFTLTGVTFATTNGQTFTFSGTIVGSTAQRGLGVTSSTPSSVINNGSITGGANGGVFTSVGANITATTLVNNGTIAGGSHTGAGGGGLGLLAQSGSNVINNGLIQGGSSAGGNGAQGVALGGSATGDTSSLTNNGIIRGGNGLNGGRGVQMRTHSGILTNNGTIEGGSNANAITVQGLNGKIVNNGTIRAGAGMADAIVMDPGAASLDLELHAGSVIQGNVVSSAALTDILRLGGAADGTFDLSSIGATAQYRNFDTFEKTGSSKWTLSGTDTSATNWTIYDGTLAVNGTVGGTVDVQAAGRLQGIGQVGTTTSAGTIAPGNSIGTLTIAGNYTGNGSTLEIETVLGGDTSPSDRLVVTGNTSGTTNVKVINLGGSGAQTVEGIKIVDVGGISAGNFSLLGDYVFQGDQAVIGGAYAYRLYQNGIATPADGDWYLRSTLIDPSGAVIGPIYQPGAPLYEAYPQLLLGLNGLSTLQQRLGDRYWSGNGATVSPKGPDNVWLRTEGTHASFEPDSSTTVDSYGYDLFKLEGGLDAELYQNQNGRLIGGLTVHYGTVSGDIGSVYGDGDIDTRGYGVGATLTWYGENGTYVDAQSQATWYDSDLKSDLVDGAMESGNNGFGYALSLEAGRRFAASGPWSITPQAQLVYSSVDFDTFNDRFGARVSRDDGDSLVGRLGVALDREETVARADGQTAGAKIYGIANLYGELLDGTAVDVSGTGFETRNDPVWAGLTLGGSYIWNDERYSLYGEVAAKSSLKDFGDSYALSGTAGFRVKW